MLARFLVLAGLLATPALAQQVTPSFGLDPSGTLRNLSVTDPTLSGSGDARRVPIGQLSTTSHTFTPTMQPVNPEMYGAISGDLIDDTAAVQQAVSAGSQGGRPVSGLGKPYRVSGSIVMSDNLVLQDITLLQTQSGAGINVRTLTNTGGGTGPFTLRRVKIDYTGMGTTAGTTNGESNNGLYIAGAHDIDIDGLEITGSGRSYGGTIYGSNNIRIRRLWVHDIWSEGSVEPEHEVGGGFDMHTDTDWQLTDFKIDNLGSAVSWSANAPLDKVQGRPWRYNAGKHYRASTYGPYTVSGSTAPTCTSGTCSDGVVTWEYMGAYPAVRRNYQMDGLHIDNAIRATVSNGVIKNVWEGMDHTSSFTSGLYLSNMLYVDTDAYGEKWGYCATNASSLGSRVIRPGIAGYVLGSGVVATCGPDHVSWINNTTINAGANKNWQPLGTAGFSLGFDNTPGVYDAPQNIQLINPVIIDDQTPITTNYGIVAGGAVPTAAQLVITNPRIESTTPLAAPYQGMTAGMIQILPSDGSTKVTGDLAVTGTLGVSAWPVSAPNGVITLKRNDPGNPVIPLYIGNSTAPAVPLGSAALIDASATGQNTVRSVQFGGELTTAGQNAQKFTVKTSANADIPIERFWCGLGCVIGTGATPTGGDKGLGSLNVANGIYDNGANINTIYPRVSVASTFTARQIMAVTSAGAMTIPLALSNTSTTANTEVCLDLAPNAVGVGVRSAQICSQNLGGTGEGNLVFRTAGGAPQVTKLTLPISTNAFATFSGPVRITPQTFATVPSCAAGFEGTFAAITDATLNTYNAAAAGGGSFHVPIYCNGTAWLVH